MVKEKLFIPLSIDAEAKKQPEGFLFAVSKENRENDEKVEVVVQKCPDHLRITTKDIKYVVGECIGVFVEGVPSEDDEIVIIYKSSGSLNTNREIIYKFINKQWCRDINEEPKYTMKF